MFLFKLPATNTYLNPVACFRCNIRIANTVADEIILAAYCRFQMQTSLAKIAVYHGYYQSYSRYKK